MVASLRWKLSRTSQETLACWSRGNRDESAKSTDRDEGESGGNSFFRSNGNTCLPRYMRVCGKTTAEFEILSMLVQVRSCLILIREKEFYEVLKNWLGMIYESVQ